MKTNQHNLMRYVMAAFVTALLCLPIVHRTMPYPSKVDVWCYGLVVIFSVPALCAVCLMRYMPRLHVLDGIVLLWMFYIACNYWFVSAYPATEDFRKATALCFVYVALRLVIPYCGKAFGQVWIIGLCLSGIYQIYVGIAQLVGYETSHHYRYAMTGTFFNPGPYAILVAAVIAIASAWLYMHREAWKDLTLLHKIFWVVNYFVLVGGLPVLAATWSRTAWLALTIVVTGIFWHEHRRIVNWGLVVVACLSVWVYFLKQDSANGRLLMTLVSGKAWLTRWFTGHGIGGFAHAYGEAQAAFFSGHLDSPLLSVAGSPEYAFNALIGVGVEQGIIGMICALVLFLWSVVILFRKRELSVYGYAILLVTSMFSYPFSLWPFRLWAVVWVAYAASLHGGTGNTSHLRWKKIIGGAIAILPAISVVKWVGDAVYRAETYREFRFISGIKNADLVDDFRRIYETQKDSPDFLFTYSKVLRELGRYNESNAVLRQGTMVSCDPMFYTLMGNNYRDLGAVEEAEAAYRKAFGMLPGRMYPLYRLMKLYEDEEEWQKAEKMAREIITFNPKVDSPAVREMKEEAEKLIGK